MVSLLVALQLRLSVSGVSVGDHVSVRVLDCDSLSVDEVVLQQELSYSIKLNHALDIMFIHKAFLCNLEPLVLALSFTTLTFLEAAATHK